MLHTNVIYHDETLFTEYLSYYLSLQFFFQIFVIIISLKSGISQEFYVLFMYLNLQNLENMKQLLHF